MCLGCPCSNHLRSMTSIRFFVDNEWIHISPSSFGKHSVNAKCQNIRLFEKIRKDQHNQSEKNIQHHRFNGTNDSRFFPIISSNIHNCMDVGNWKGISRNCNHGWILFFPQGFGWKIFFYFIRNHQHFGANSRICHSSINSLVDSKCNI